MLNSQARLSWEPIILQLRNPFKISYGVSETRRAIWLRLAGAAGESDDVGWGEASIPPYYGVSLDEMAVFWQKVNGRFDPFPDDPAEIAAWVGADGPAPARCAVDLALHDRIARQRGVPLYELLGLEQPPHFTTSFTIGIDTPAEMARQAVQVANYPIIKVKLGSEDDESRLAAIRAARPDAELCVDVNGGWSREEAVQNIHAFERFDLTFVEQPLPKDDIEGLGYVQSQVDLPIVADETVQTLADVERLAAVGVQGINLKLMKVGGLAAGLQMLRRGRELGMRIMLGCMVETSLGTTAMAHLAGLADWFDLDAPLLIQNDPFEGLVYDERAGVYLPDRVGIGVVSSEQ